MIAWLEARVWQIGTIGATAMAFGLAIALSISTARLHDARADADALTAAIEAPVTGWAARLTTCQNNGLVLQAGIESQNAAIKRNGEESAKRLADAEKALSAAQRQAGLAEAKVKAIMKPLVGSDQCVRFIEADERLMESLN